uniref:Uncharacterized protein n=1 Tax=Anguilla anguilla TaxID=7936 RepID=A0A0E9QLA0_ANGAN
MKPCFKKNVHFTVNDLHGRQWLQQRVSAWGNLSRKYNISLNENRESIYEPK